ncbi:cytochrome b/b6 domain-containing protein [Bordetella avium]|uniref:cytochrome b/b6 domain-containing protein n=1 Tax=Bordetella avium TaxID=521 RepID=UPI000E6A63DF|nr:cytochrome b/b6 domain-containing protein [Bordetella avium]RIQ18081.1 cytochrome b/b6 domain-containing protein [Bordetella avium]RIQ36552.1 cytochrome b/b6 domain-containing protein [Bordetella avium]
MRWIPAFWRYLGDRQTPKVRVVHMWTLLLVITQIVISNFMHVPKDTWSAIHGANAFFSWLHIACGLVLLCLTGILAAQCFKSRGFTYYFPYLRGDFAQLSQDLRLLANRQLPGAQARGLAACVQGLGLGAMGLVTLSGAAWLLLWLSGQALAPDLRSLHKTLTGLVEAYLYGHGGMGLLHFYLQRKHHPDR